MDERTSGHRGMGGSIGLADRTRGLAMGCVMNRRGSSGAALVDGTSTALLA